MVDEAYPDTRDAVSFGPFRLVHAERRLERDGMMVPLGGRALDILSVLVERAGEVVSKRELAARVWPDVSVEEGSLRFHIAALRKALEDGKDGARYVTNAPGRGYSFVARVSRSGTKQSPASARSTQRITHNLPASLTRMVGRNDAALTIVEQLATYRFVTIVGPGGIGKTTVAVAVAHAMHDDFEGCVRFVDLGMLSDPGLVSTAVSLAVEAPVQSDTISGLIGFLKDKKMLLVLDSCEHVIDVVAMMAERIFLEAPGISVLATSREPLRVEGERAHRLFPLDYPPNDIGLTAMEALGFPAVQLFVERVSAASSGFVLANGDAAVVADICRKLDGIALAIEFAAGYVDAYGLREVSALLDGRLKMLWHGRRTAPKRHQTLNATLDWSYELLDEPERVVLNRLSVFAGTFTLQAARSVAVNGEIRENTIADILESLVAKSLISADISRRTPQYRLLDMTRSYARVKLVDSGELNDVARRHAIYCHRLLDGKATNANSSAKLNGTTVQAKQINDIRTALEWSFSPGGDVALGVSLAADSATLFLSMSLLQECQRWTEQAITALDEITRGTRIEMVLSTSLGMSLLSRHDLGEASQAAFGRALEVAERLKDTAQQLLLLSNLRIFKFSRNDTRSALDVSIRIKNICNELGDAAQIAVAECTLGMTYCFIGDQSKAQLHSESGLVAVNTRYHENPELFENDVFDQTRCALSLTLWLRGFADQAMQAARQIIHDASAYKNPLSLVNSILRLCRLVIQCGDLAMGERLIDQLQAYGQKYGLNNFILVSSGFRGELLIALGEVEMGVALLRRRLDGPQGDFFRADYLLALADGLCRLGDFEIALRTIDQAVEFGDRYGESWRTPEIFRQRGHILGFMPGSDPAHADEWLSRSREMAQRQSALSWELRCATSLARLRHRQGRIAEARDRLATVYGRFTEGFTTPDLKTARDLLAELS